MLSKDQLEEVATLVKLSFDEETLEKFTNEVNVLVELGGNLQEVDIEGVQPTYHGNRLLNVYRDDKPIACDHLEKIFADAPAMSEEGYLEVPVIIESEDNE